MNVSKKELLGLPEGLKHARCDAHHADWQPIDGDLIMWRPELPKHGISSMGRPGLADQGISN